MIKRILVAILFGCVIAQDYPVLGSSQSLDVMTWNVENYPKHNQTNSYLINIINQINIDVIAFQEIENQNAFNNLINQLDGNWVGYRVDPGSNWGELSYAINLDEIVINNIYNILSEDAYFFAYREPYVVEFTHQGIDYVIINNHFKCCGDEYLDLNNTSDEEYRRLIASQLLEDYIDENLGSERVIVLGDLNDSLTDDQSNNVFWGFLNSDNFLFADYDIADGPSNNWSYPTWPSHLDHIIITDELFSDFENSDVLTFKVDDYLSGGWNSYENYISDHRPVFMRMDFNEFDLGDINVDGSLDILDVITIVNLVLIGEYNELGDMNYDGTLNVMDVVIVVNSILN
jgi:exonuclease III